MVNPNPELLLSAHAFLNKRPVKKDNRPQERDYVKTTTNKLAHGTIKKMLNGICLVLLDDGTSACFHVDDLEKVDKPKTKPQISVACMLNNKFNVKDQQ